VPEGTPALRILIFGATGMVGQGVLRECLLDPGIARVQTVGRTATGTADARLRELALPDLRDLAAAEAELASFDACFFCLGVSSSGMTEAAYTRVTYDLTLAVGETLARLNPGMTFIYVSGTGTDSSERGRSMWARVKGRTENALSRLALRAFMFRPGIIEPLHGIRSKTPAYRLLYRLTGPLLPLLRAAFPDLIVTTEQVGRAMISVARHGAPARILENRDIRAAAARLDGA
jgi:uncharacterized protein YbjT (DUF2867 family)